ncbi:hypothetical protein B0I35DRAFT_426336 [Stachybotrys elegans]|uniref:Uncharacterized protein n=1 Tax=Stachybotrys elegans TaxID=80388 RepID=A0A8K0STR2_9HYPO|nr:hypothetical protein B0I35DRAFT_426336 [Stachybotrys elegans]
MPLQFFKLLTPCKGHRYCFQGSEILCPPRNLASGVVERMFILSSWFLKVDQRTLQCR